MPKKVGSVFTQEQYDQQYQREQAYIKKNLKFVNVPFNSTKAEDMELYDWLNRIDEPKTQYIKRLISEDMEKGG